MKRHGAGLLALCIFVLGAPRALAAKNLVVEEDLIAVSPPDENGLVSVAGPPRTVIAGPQDTAQFTVENRGVKPRPTPVAGIVAPDGSFLVRLPGAAGNKIRIVFSTLGGSSKKVTKKVPPGPPRAVSLVEKSAFSQSAPRKWQPPPEPTPEVFIRYRDSTARSAAAPPDPDEEVRSSGVLPPD